VPKQHLLSDNVASEEDDASEDDSRYDTQNADNYDCGSIGGIT